MELTNPIFLCKVSSNRVADTCMACDQGGSCGNSFFSYPEDIAMAKPFLTFQAQISFLEQDKNLLIENHTFAEAMLTRSLRSFASFSRKNKKHCQISLTLSLFVLGILLTNLVTILYAFLGSQHHLSKT